MKCVIVSGAPENNIEYYFDYIKKNTFVICADSGYIKCEKLNITPDLIIGDFDSSKMPALSCDIIKLNVRKDDSDTFHCVKTAVDLGYEEIIILGGIGSRIDHTYSNILSLYYCINHSVKSYLINADNKVFITDKPTVLNNDKYKFFSLFALFETVYGLNIKGADYDIEDYDLLPTDQITQSNGFIGRDVSINFNSGKLLIILCND